MRILIVTEYCVYIVNLSCKLLPTDIRDSTLFSSDKKSEALLLVNGEYNFFFFFFNLREVYDYLD